MAIVELIGSISLAIALVSAIALVIIHIKNKNKQNDIKYIHDRSLNNIEQTDIKNNDLQKEIYQSSSVLPFEEFNNKKELSIINVINNDDISSSSIKYGIQWALPSTQESQSEIINSISNNILKTSEFEQGDSLSFSDQTISVRNLIKKFENNSIRKLYRKEKNNQTDSDLTSIDTNFDNQTIKTDINQNQQKLSHHSSISNIDITIPSNLSSSIDLEHFECFSSTSNLSEYLNNN